MSSPSSASAGDITDMKSILARIAQGERLSADDAAIAFDIIMSGNATPSQMGGFLMGLRVRGETVDEIVGAARVMRAKVVPVEAPAGTIDTCGTGGDGQHTYNISTAAALVIAACGVPVAKHGNRAVSSKSGAADVLGSLGVNLDCDMALVRKALWDAGIGFLMAPRHHLAMRNVGPTRVELGTRTIFNVLGPLANPALAKRQLLGVYTQSLIEPLAATLQRLGSEAAWVVHGSDGLDEITTTGPTHVARLHKGELSTFQVTPEDAGLPRSTMDQLRGGDAAYNAQAIHDLFNGKTGAYRDIVLMNTAAALIVAEKVSTLPDGVAMAAQAIDSGAARERLAALVSITNESTAA